MRAWVMSLALALAGCASAPAAPDAIPAAALRQDFAALYEGLQRAHYDLYANTPRAEYDAAYRRMRAEIDAPMTRLAAQVLFQRFVAFSEVAHARIDFPGAEWEAFRAGGGRAFPLAVRIDDGRLFVTGNLSGVDAVAPGDEIMTLNGASAAAWIARVRQHVSADTDYLAYAQIDRLWPALLWLEGGAVESYALTLRGGDGVERSVAVPARTRAEMQAAAATLAPSLSIDITERVARVLPGGVAYLRPGIFLNYPGENMYDTAPFHAFIDSAFADFISAGAHTLLIDLRDNPGGDNSFSDHMIAWFADEPFRFTSDFRIRVSPETTASNAARRTAGDEGSISAQFSALYDGARNGDVVSFEIPYAEPRAGRRFTGRVLVLINRRSFSNAVNVAAIIQDYGFGQILGEPTSDLATTYGAMEQFSLPNTALMVGYPKAFILRPNGDTAVAGVTPDIAIATPLIEPAQDPVLEQALAIASRR